MPGHVLEAWERICKLPARGADKNKRKAEFQAEVCAVEGNNYDTEFFRKFRKVEDTTNSGTTWSWVSWTKLVDKFGIAVANEMVHTGNVTSRKYPWVDDEKTQLKFPDTHEFRVEIEGGSKMRTKTEGMNEYSGKVQGDAEAFDEAFEKKAPDVPARPKPKAQPPKERTESQRVLGELKAAHRNWDEQKKNIYACVAKAKDDPYVAIKLVTDLKAILKPAQEKDEALSKHEIEEKNGKVWTENDFQKIRELVAQLKDDMDRSKKIVKEIENIQKQE